MNKFKKIADRLGEGELLLQLVEELLELADVSVCLRALGLDTNNRPVMLQVTRTMNEKTQRWVDRLEAANEHHEGDGLSV